MIYLDETMVEGRRWFYTNGKDLSIEVCKIEHDRSKTSLMSLWVKKGWLPKFIDTTWSIRCYFYREDGSCVEAFNPQIKQEVNENGCAPKNVIDFDWELEATPENLQKIFNEIERRYYLYHGSDQESYEYLLENATDNRWNGEGWYTIETITEPDQAVWVSSREQLKTVLKNCFEPYPRTYMYGNGAKPNNPNVHAA